MELESHDQINYENCSQCGLHNSVTHLALSILGSECLSVSWAPDVFALTEVTLPFLAYLMKVKMGKNLQSQQPQSILQFFFSCS